MHDINEPVELVELTEDELDEVAGGWNNCGGGEGLGIGIGIAVAVGVGVGVVL